MDAVTLERRIQATIKLALVGAIALGIVAMLLPFRPFFYGRPDFEGISQWLRTQDLAPGVHYNVALPFPYAHRADGGTIDVVVSPDEEFAILLKTDIGWKQNFEGYVYGTRPHLGGVSIWGDYYGRTCILFSDRDEPVVKRRIDDQTYEVFFDLN